MTESATGPGQASEPSTRPLPVFSFPRCGRAWLTHIWFHYALALTVTEHLFPEGPPTLQRPNDDPRFQDFVVPRLLQAGLRPLQFRHGFTIEKGQRDLIEKVSPDRRLAFILRDPAKVMESFADRMKSADRPGKGPRYPETREMSISQIIRSERHGICRMIEYYRVFDAAISDQHHSVYYEDMRADAASVFHGLLTHAGHADPDMELIEQAVRNSSFERMQAWERDKRIRKNQSLDPAAFRIRSASTRPALAPEDVAYIQAEVRASGVRLLERYI